MQFFASFLNLNTYCMIQLTHLDYDLLILIKKDKNKVIKNPAGNLEECYSKIASNF